MDGREIHAWICLLLALVPLAGSDGHLPRSGLKLTPYIQDGDIDTARNLSRVDTVIPGSHAGYLTVNASLGNHLFFWFCPSDNGMDAPLLVWLNGGPGVSSMLGLLYENGPIRLTTNKLLWGNPEAQLYEDNPYSWTGPFSMLYIDNPVGVGYSYTEDEEDGYRTTQDWYAHDLYMFMEQFYLLFPELMSTELYVGGQSYAGKYVPSLAFRIHEEIQANRSQIPLAGIYIGGPYFDPITEAPAYFDFLFSLGVISDQDRLDRQAAVHEQVEIFLNGTQPSNITTSSLFSVVVPPVPILDIYNYVSPDLSPYYDQVQLVMNSEEVREAVHAGNGSYLSANDALGNRFGSDIFETTKDKLGALMDNYKVLIFNGDMDVITNSAMIEAALLTTVWSHQDEYATSSRDPWWRPPFNPSGYVTYVGNFCRVVLHKSGHMVPKDQPSNALYMMENFVFCGCVEANNCTRNYTVAPEPPHIPSPGNPTTTPDPNSAFIPSPILSVLSMLLFCFMVNLLHSPSCTVLRL